MPILTPVLNESFDFYTMAPPDVRAAFKGGRIESKERLRAGTKLYKWTQYPMVGPRGITPWWSLLDETVLSTGTQVPGFHTVQKRVGGGFQDRRDYARARNAVTMQWNQMSKPLVVQLLQDVYAFIGITAHQPVNTGDRSVLYIGGDCQVWLPGLTIHHVRQVSALPYIRPSGV